MARPSRTSGKMSGAKTRKANSAKGRHAAKIKPPKNSAVSAHCKELQEAHEQQAATAEILKVIASSPGDVQPVFDAIVVSAVRLIGGFSAGVYRFVDDSVHLAATTTVSPVGDEVVRANFPRPIGGDHFRTVLGGEVVEFADTEDQANARLKEVARVRGFRSIVYVPLKSARTSIGVIAVSRKTTGAFATHHVELLQTFAEQAVIAIENARMFDQLQHRTNELAESLEQQAATSEVLEVISLSIGNVQPVFDKLLESATRVCGAQFGAMGLFDGEVYRRVALCNTPPAFDNAAPKEWRPGPDGPIGRVLYTGDVIRFDDLRESPTYLARHPATVAMVEVAKARTLAVVPMLRDGRPIGSISIYRQVVRPFSDKQIELLKNFASQAVIAIENARLFNETREALERQIATAEVLKVIASSPSDVQPVFEAIASSANRLLGGFSSTVFLFSNGMAHLKAFTPTTREADEVLTSAFPRPITDVAPFQMTEAGEAVQIPDTEAPTYQLREIARARGYRSMLFTPLMNKGTSIGFIAVTRLQAGTFADHHVQLLKTFADQAVIAIENTRLFNETQEALEQQTATADILKVIASSPDDVQPVFDAIAARSNQLVGGLSATVLTISDDAMHLRAFTPGSPQADAALKSLFPMPLPAIPWHDAILRGETFRITDMENENPLPPLAVREMARLRGYRSVVIVPLMRDGKAIGTIGVTRVQPGAFADHHIQLLQTFADQAVIAISNVELFREVEQRTRELSQSLDDLRTAQDRLIQTEKLASLGQLTAGIAHEIKNPLNFVNNFSALSAELTDELNDVLKPVVLDDNVRGEVDELTGMLKDNLEKVVQHGKRADSIVKNMLLHSREGSGEHRPADINSLLDESLNLAYHGARAEKGEFNITLQRDFDTDAGAIELFPQEITRAFLNLIANGVYAATKRKTEVKEPGFEPTLRATTKNLGSTVEIRIRDNGTGIPVEVREKMFNPFFTTKPAGEGTGLGLSMTYDIIVKQHGGRIDVATEPGQFTEFTIVLPRKSNLSGVDRGKT
jgi:GAF domain-containing protein